MPNNYDFNEVKDIQEIEIDVDGWVSPLTIEYGTGLSGGVPSYFWRVKETSHTFEIPILRMDFLSKGDYDKHFKEVLSVFREDYKGWQIEGWYADWMQEYRGQYGKLISL